MDEHTLNDLLECSVCLERLDTSSKVLPCQHTFCRKCLEVIVASHQELRCPECRVLVAIRIDELPPNVLLMRILEGLKNATSAATKNPEELKLEILQPNKQIAEKQRSSPLQQQQQQPQTNAQQPQSSTTTTNSQRHCLLPHAYALYDFGSSEPSDLNFKKGDLILLKRKIDINWYVGQLNGLEGTFPSNYVQVIVPLPTPQCIALYDFKMGPNEEEGCLSFKKGTYIHVLRRVDHNWAEGRIGNMIGIFPIAFVELNALAKQILDRHELLPMSANQSKSLATAKESLQQQPQQLHNQSNSSVVALQPTRHLPPIPMLGPILNQNASDNSTTSPTVSISTTTSSSASNTNSATSNSRTTTASSCSSSSSLPNSPQQSLPTTPQHYAHGSGSVRYRNGREKRHSLHALLSNPTPALSILQTNRHSAEILSIPSEDLNVSGACISQDAMVKGVAVPQSTVAREQQQQASALQTATRVNVLKSANGPTNLPWGYLALYPYKPRKSDELELKKGCVYIVTERCLDGWFKGKNWQDISGVFPGNYVTPLRARDQQQLMHQWKYVPQVSTSLVTTNPAATATQTSQANNSRNPNQSPPPPTSATYAVQKTPPDLPPRNSMTTTCSSVWTRPLSHTVEAFFNRHNTTAKPPVASNENATNDKSKDKDLKSKDSSTSAAVSLMKRLTSIKSRAKSPANVARNSAASPSHQAKDNGLPVNTDCTQPSSPQVVASVHPVHVRSGSCPSQLLQNLPLDLAINKNQLPLNQHQQKQQQQHPPSMILNHGSERIKGHKERPRIHASARQSMEGIYNITPPLPTTMPNNIFLNNKCAQQYNLQQPAGNNHRKSQSLDANNILIGAGNMPTLVPSTAAVASMQNCNITAAAVTASATTKSTQSGRESRFRCIVPYPPNSDVELELHVGDIIYIQRKQKNGWYKGTHARTKKTGLFPASFVEPDL